MSLSIDECLGEEFYIRSDQYICELPFFGWNFSHEVLKKDIFNKIKDVKDIRKNSASNSVIKKCKISLGKCEKDAYLKIFEKTDSDLKYELEIYKCIVTNFQEVPFFTYPIFCHCFTSEEYSNYGWNDIHQSMNSSMCVICTEDCGSKQLANFCVNASKKEWCEICYQMTFVLEFLKKEKLIHFDMHFGNILVQSEEEFTYKDLHFKNKVKVFDWDRSMVFKEYSMSDIHQMYDSLGFLRQIAYLNVCDVLTDLPEKIKDGMQKMMNFYPLIGSRKVFYQNTDVHAFNKLNFTEKNKIKHTVSRCLSSLRKYSENELKNPREVWSLQGNKFNEEKGSLAHKAKLLLQKDEEDEKVIQKLREDFSKRIPLAEKIEERRQYFKENKCSQFNTIFENLIKKKYEKFDNFNKILLKTNREKEYNNNSEKDLKERENVLEELFLLKYRFIFAVIQLWDHPDLEKVLKKSENLREKIKNKTKVYAKLCRGENKRIIKNLTEKYKDAINCYMRRAAFACYDFYLKSVNDRSSHLKQRIKDFILHCRDVVLNHVTNDEKNDIFDLLLEDLNCMDFL